MGIAKFEKVSYTQFKEDMINTYGDLPEGEIQRIYDNIKIPKRATKGSAGYDFFSPLNFSFNADIILLLDKPFEHNINIISPSNYLIPYFSII